VSRGPTNARSSAGAKQIDVAATWDGDLSDPLPTHDTITAWTRRSRGRLVEPLSDLDYTKLYSRFRVCDDFPPRIRGQARALSVLPVRT
jgi:hypothetical protein